MESPPPYDAALQQQVKKDSPIQQQRLQSNNQQQFLLQQQQKDYMGSSSRLISGSNTPTQPGKHMVSHSYTAVTPSQNNLQIINSTPTIGASLHNIQYQQQQQQQQTNLQYTTVQNLENRARSRNPLNGLSSEIDHQQQQQQHTQYSTMAQLNANPIDV